MEIFLNDLLLFQERKRGQMWDLRNHQKAFALWWSSSSPVDFNYLHFKNILKFTSQYTYTSAYSSSFLKDGSYWLVIELYLYGKLGQKIFVFNSRVKRAIDFFFFFKFVPTYFSYYILLFHSNAIAFNFVRLLFDLQSINKLLM